MRIARVQFLGPSFTVGQAVAKERYANDGPIHVAMLGESWIAIWDDRDPEAVIVPRERVREVRLAKAELMAAMAGSADDLLERLTAPDAAQNGQAAPAKPAKTAAAAKGEK